MNSIALKFKNDLELQDCIRSAFDDLQLLLKDSFIRISRLPNQLTFNDLFSLFICYDWQDIFNALEKLENSSSLAGIKSVWRSLKISLTTDQIPKIADPRENSYFKVWAGLMTDSDF